MTTPTDTFEHLIRHQTAQQLLPFLLSLDKKDVVPVRQKTLRLKKELEEYQEREVKPGQLQWTCLMTPEQGKMLFLAGLATYSRKEALGRGFDIRWSLDWDSPNSPTADNSLALKVLEYTRPDWLAEWLTRRTRANLWAAPPYQVLRTLETRALLAHEPWLFAQSVAHLPSEYNGQRNDVEGGDIEEYDQLILRDLRTNTTLLERDVLLLFDFDTMADSASTYSGKARTTVSWLTLLPELVTSGHLGREDLLTRCLLALRRDFRRPLLTWFKNLFSSLNPTPAECLARQTELTELLAHPLPLVVNFALDQLKDLWLMPAFELDALLRAADGLMTRQDLKTGLKTLLVGFGKLLKTQPAQALPLARLHAAALAHADSAVQERAAKGLAELLSAKKPLLAPAEIAETTATILAYADLLAPATRAVLAPWLAAVGAAALPDTEAEPAHYESLTELVPDLSAATAIVPVADWHELLFLTGQVLKHDDALALERWLDGLLRLRGQFPAGYADLLQPYVGQVHPYLSGPAAERAAAVMQDAAGGRAGGHALLPQLLLLSWANGFAEPFVARTTIADTYFVPDPLVAVAQQRLAFAEALLVAGPELPLLSTPTHAPCWVAPSKLLENLLAYQTAQQAPNPADLAVALARTAWQAPASAEAARQLLPQLQHIGLRALLAWLLAPTEEPLPALPAPAEAGATPLAEALPWLWAVAARTRQPAGHFPALASLTDNPCPNVAQPWQPVWELLPKSNTYVERWRPGEPEVTEHWLELLILDKTTRSPAPSKLLIYSLHNNLVNIGAPHQWRCLQALATDFPFLVALLPQYPAPLYWHVLGLAATRDTVDSTNREVLLQALRSLLGPGPLFDEPTTLLLAIGLTYNAPACRALALEALLAAVAERRLLPAALGAALGRLLGGGFVPMQRLADGLAELRAIDALTDAALHQTLDALLPALPAEPLRNTRKLLDTYADLQSRTRQPTPPPVQARLREWQATASLKKSRRPAAGVRPC
ncbi:DUF6493 family protein [Hymenobacter sp. H14-R3]|uniref:DUF6493 family protein n=1 Tax=Hymenobacter sp. H14-R3 TaxID=3046308 RepID=UPI0024B96FE4|nr:DUF6493 family protein [Hymenobacter sp. H14-R3]MDJ0365792.1 DUF6493 family protein [Hymenobacter sp. H14-R3]